MISQHFQVDKLDKNKISRNVFFLSSIIYISMLISFIVGWFVGLNTKDISPVIVSLTTAYVTIASWYNHSTSSKEREEIKSKRKTEHGYN